MFGVNSPVLRVGVKSEKNFFSPKYKYHMSGVNSPVLRVGVKSEIYFFLLHTSTAGLV